MENCSWPQSSVSNCRPISIFTNPGNKYRSGHVRNYRMMIVCSIGRKADRLRGNSVDNRMQEYRRSGRMGDFMLILPMPVPPSHPVAVGRIHGPILIDDINGIGPYCGCLGMATCFGQHLSVIESAAPYLHRSVIQTGASSRGKPDRVETSIFPSQG